VILKIGFAPLDIREGGTFLGAEVWLSLLGPVDDSGFLEKLPLTLSTRFIVKESTCHIKQELIKSRM